MAPVRMAAAPVPHTLQEFSRRANSEPQTKSGQYGKVLCFCCFLNLGQATVVGWLVSMFIFRCINQEGQEALRFESYSHLQNNLPGTGSGTRIIWNSMEFLKHLRKYCRGSHGTNWLPFSCPGHFFQDSSDSSVWSGTMFHGKAWLAGSEEREVLNGLQIVCCCCSSFCSFDVTDRLLN